MISKAQEQVRQFTLALKGEGRNRVSHFPGKWPPQENVKELCKKLIVEEYKELIDAIDQDDWPEIIDGAADLIYVVLFLCVKTGIELEDFWQEVCQNNMTKIGGPIDPETGKQLKPPGWQPPRIQELYDKARKRYEVMDKRGAVLETHELKTAPIPFQAIWKGNKMYEWRQNDRNYAVGDFLLLREYDESKKGTVLEVLDGCCPYTGREVLAQITYITHEAVMTHYYPNHEVGKDMSKHWVVLSLDVLDRIE